jgi:hypothetical protein
MMKKTKATGVHKNALSHGVHAQDLVLPWENQRDFVDFHRALQSDLEPDGPVEEEAVLEIASLYWKKRRLTIGSQLAYRRHPDAAALCKAGQSGWSGVGEYLESISEVDGVSHALRGMAKSHASTLQSAFAKVNERLAKMEFSPVPQTGEQLDKYSELRSESQVRRTNDQLDALTELTNGLNAIGTSVIIPVLKMIENQDIEHSLAERAFRPDIIEREVKVSALIDKQIEKGLARLVHLKKYKRLYKKKQITASSMK